MDGAAMAAIATAQDDRLGAPGPAVAFVKLVAFAVTLVVVLVGLPLTAALAIYTLAS
jgi:hypothetical protein